MVFSLHKLSLKSLHSKVAENYVTSAASAGVRLVTIDRTVGDPDDLDDLL